MGQQREAAIPCHPHNKAPLGDRLARIALANVYGRKIEYLGPVYSGMKVDGDVARLRFAHVGGGLLAKGGPLKWFQVAGGDGAFFDAEARIEGDTVVVGSPQVKAPVAVRYAWDNYPDGCNLFNAAVPIPSICWNGEGAMRPLPWPKIFGRNANIVATVTNFDAAVNTGQLFLTMIGRKLFAAGAQAKPF